MVRGRSYRGSSRGGSAWNGSSSRGYPGKYSTFSSGERGAYEPKPKYPTAAERFSRSEDYYKPYRSEYSSSLGRERRSPDRKRLRLEAPSSRHESYYSTSRHEPSYSERRGMSSERHSSSMFSRREEFRRPSGPPKRASYRGRISSRGSRGLRGRDRGARRRLVEGSYAIRRRLLPPMSDYQRRLKISRMRSAIARKARIAEENKEDEAEEKPDEENVKSDIEDDEEKKKHSKAFIKLQCPHCGMKAQTFRRYETHLRSRSHLVAMRKIAFKQKAILGQMRHAQRNTQNELEKTATDDLSERTSYCPTCRLNYKQKKAIHQLSEAHNNMKKFLMPFCKVCNISFRSPMMYESHCCSIEHIKRRHRAENSDASGEEDNLENFTTIDSVGEIGDDADGKEPVGIEKIRKLEAYYCDLCKMYLQRCDEDEMAKIMARHCRQKVHVVRFKRMKDKEEAALKAENGGDDNKGEEENKDDKLWADVDKDLGDILAEADSGNKSSDDEDSHINGERYDRFKLSEKNGDEKMITNEDEKLIIGDSALQAK